MRKAIGIILRKMACITLGLFLWFGLDETTAATATSSVVDIPGTSALSDQFYDYPFNDYLFNNGVYRDNAVSSYDKQVTNCSISSQEDKTQTNREIIYKAQSTADDYINWGWSSYWSGDYDAGITYFTNAIDLNPYSDVAYDGRGWCKVAQGNYTDAKKDFDTAIGLNSFNSDAFGGRAECYYESGQYSLAADDYTAAIKLDNNWKWYYSGRGWCYYLMGSGYYDAAITDFNQAISMDSRQPDFFYGRGLCYYEKEDYPRAITDFNSAISYSTDPNWVWPYRYRGLSYYNQNNYDSASKDFSVVIEKGQGNGWDFYLRGQCYLNLVRQSDAIQDFNRAIAFNKDWAGAYNARGWAYLELRQYDLAIGDFNKAIICGMTWEGIYVNRGWANYYGGYVDNARVDFQLISDTDYGKLSRAELCFLLAYHLNLIPVSSPQAEFIDVNPYSFNGPIIYAVDQAGLVDGYPDGSFRPDNNITRSELAKLLVRAFDLPIIQIAAPTFSDVNNEHWAYSYIEAVYLAGIMYGYNDGAFLPNDEVTIFDAVNAFEQIKHNSQSIQRIISLGIMVPGSDGFHIEGIVTRADFAQIVCRLTGLETTAANQSSVQGPFSDVSPTDWFNGYVNVGVQNGLLQGTESGTFYPYSTVSQAEAITLLLRILGYNDQLPGAWPSDYIAKAANLGIIDDIVFSAHQPIYRGQLALVISSLLDEMMVSYSAVDNVFIEIETTLFKRYFSGSHLFGDLNGDNLIDIHDLSQVALCYGQSIWQADLNRDGIVDLFDLVLVSRCISGF